MTRPAGWAAAIAARFSPVAAAAALMVLAGCAPDVSKKEEPPAAPAAEPATTATASKAAPAGSAGASKPAPGSTADMATRLDQNFTSASIERRASPPPAGFKLPFPDAMAADGITPGKRGGSFTYVAFGDGPKTFDPVTANDSGSNEVISRMFTGLVEFNNQTQVYTPGLLKAWTMEADKRNWMLELRDGMQWSDGKPITADDVIFSAKVIYDPNVANAAKDVLQVAGKPFEFEKVDDHRIRVKLAAPSGSFQALIGGVTVIPKHVYEETWKAGKYEQALNVNVDPAKVVVSGPFKLKKYESGQRVILERNPYYHKYDKNGTQLPYLDTLILTYAPDMDQMLSRFQSGTADGFIRPRPDSVADLKDGEQKGNYTLYDCGPGDGANVFWFNLKDGVNPTSKKPFVDPLRQKWFDDVRFRRAAMHALDKESVIRTELRGLAVSVWGLESPAVQFWYNPDNAKYPYDPAKAKALLDEMDLKDRNGDGIREDAAGNKVTFTFITNKGNKVREKVASLMAADWKAVGIQATPQFVDFNTLVTMTADSFEYEACLLGFGGGGTHPASSMNVYLSSGRTHFFNPSQKTPASAWEAEVDKLAQGFNATLDVTAQRDTFLKMQAILADQCAFLPLWTSKVFVAVRNTYGNLKPSSLTHELLWNVEEIFVK